MWPVWGSGRDNLEEGLEGTCARQARGIDGGARAGLEVGGPFGAVAVGDFALDDTGA